MNALDYRVGPLDERHELMPFLCGEAALDNHLKNDSLREMDLKLSTTFVMVRDGRLRVMGFFSLSALHIRVGELSAELKDTLDRYGTIPATLIGRLAVDETLQGEGFGRALLFKALKKCLSTAASVGSAMVIVDAKPAAVGFYEKHGFVLLKKNRRLYLPMATVAEAVGEG